MSFHSFLKLVEIQTKVASMIPFTLGTLYAMFHFQQFDSKNFLYMFISLITLDMAVTAINNYYDYKKAFKTHGYGYESHNAIVKCGLKERTVVATILMLLTTSVVFGLLLFFHTDLVVLALGALSFLVGILYTFGPIPISRMPLGEAFSGIFMGFIITFISVYIHIHNLDIVNLTIERGILAFHINILEVLYIFMISIPAIHGIANIMLANNICDVEEDIENKRYTLPYYVGKENALKIFKSLYYISYVDLALLLVLGVEPIFSFIALLTLIPIHKNIQTFCAKPTKKDTFILAVKNFVLMNVVRIFTLGTALITNYIFG